MSTPGNYPPPDPWGGSGGQPQQPYQPPAQPPAQPAYNPPPQPYQPPAQPAYNPPPQPYQPPAQPYQPPAQPTYNPPPPEPTQYQQPAGSGWETQATQQIPAGPTAGQPYQSGYPQSDYSQAGYQQPYQQPGYDQSSYPPAGGWGASPPPKKKTGKTLGIIGLVVVVIAGLLAGGYFVFFQKSAPKLTFAGKKIDQPANVLTAAEANLAAIVKTRHGASNDNSRCYFAVPKTPAAGAKKSDVQSALVCGPVLFVDGDVNQPYLSFSLTSAPASGGGVTLTPSEKAQTLDPKPLPTDVNLERPDKKSAPSGSGDLKVPDPPAADKNFFGSVALGNSTVAAAPASALIGSRSGGVRLLTLGTIKRYGTGDDARSAPDGQKLISFTLAAAPSAGGENLGDSDLTMRIVSAGQSRAIPAGSNPLVIAVDDSATDVALQVGDAAVTQSISLLTGKPADTNILVGQRKNHRQDLNKNLPLNYRLSSSNGTGNQPATLNVDHVLLSYWSLNTASESVHASNPRNALLAFSGAFTLTGAISGPFTYTGGLGPFGVDPAYLSLRLPTGQVIKAKNIAPDPSKIYDVFEVPASFTTGTIVVSGSTASNGITTTINPVVNIPIAIAAG